ncbi:uncharacterized protein LOC106078221 isoform X1 [Biomphalaria glabrata]|uniref:Uncharacterized protein LOC106078221 isoform X1 n=2 Tax=Biomphalaria glabrata TaxID=6526 RepID=A0A9W2ZFQ8_BIOGL|nr:uncharacterized protein LOC106078221 isoform X1 [Biomphalaria glabrata]
MTIWSPVLQLLNSLVIVIVAVTGRFEIFNVIFSCSELNQIFTITQQNIQMAESSEVNKEYLDDLIDQTVKAQASRGLRASRCITITSLVLSLIAVVFVANFPKRAHSSDGNFYKIYDELQEKIIEEMTKFLVERHKLKQKKYEMMMRFKHTPVSAHISLSGAVRIPASEDKPESSVLVRKNIDSLDHARGVKVDKDGLVILHSGLYFVHASVTPEFSSRVAYTTWSMYIYKMRRNSQARTIKLTDTAHTFLSWTNSQNTGYSAGVFKLEAGEKLQLRLTGQSPIACDERSTFLGLFMLTSSSSYQK